VSHFFCSPFIFSPLLAAAPAFGDPLAPYKKMYVAGFIISSGECRCFLASMVVKNLAENLTFPFHVSAKEQTSFPERERVRRKPAKS